GSRSDSGNQTHFINEYGPTETVVGCSAEFVAPERRLTGPVPIGRPIANTRMYVLDATRSPVPVGVAGELYVGGVQVGAGYHGRPELTAERFVSDPFALHGRMYRTGDRARWRADGVLEYLGRLDQQVKLRGVRIELGEVESALLAHSAVRDAVAVVREDTPGDQRLVAYCVATQRADALPEVLNAVPSEALHAELRERLRQTLPEAMVPSAIVWLDALPLSPSGKIDRAALPAPSGTEVTAASAFVEPASDVERELARIWSELLRVDRVGLNDSFFALGGHSLLAMRMLGRVLQQFGVRVPLRNLFATPTIATVARVITQSAPAQVSRAIVARRADDSAPVSFVQELLWMLERASPGLAAYHIQNAFRVRGPLNRDALRRALTALVERHPSLRTVFVEEGGTLVQRVRPASDVEIHRLGGVDGTAVECEARITSVVRAFVRAPFDLAHGPVFRAGIFDIAEDDAIVVLVCHHIVSDGWSQGVMRRDLSALYDAFVRGVEPALAPLVLTYGDF
ncbi:MAG TPA: condensation domain-containing protein, partial [Candidatus Elarobacter sp.]|nr:condensation domain-containing protein [Candidatus Elarobacter sp.]